MAPTIRTSAKQVAFVAVCPCNTRSLVEIWEGGHDWAPGPSFERALAWAEDKALLEADYDPGRADLYWWYFLNKLEHFERAESDIERYVAAPPSEDASGALASAA